MKTRGEKMSARDLRTKTSNDQFLRIHPRPLASTPALELLADDAQLLLKHMAFLLKQTVGQAEQTVGRSSVPATAVCVTTAACVTTSIYFFSFNSYHEGLLFFIVSIMNEKNPETSNSCIR